MRQSMLFCQLVWGGGVRMHEESKVLSGGHYNPKYNLHWKSKQQHVYTYLQRWHTALMAHASNSESDVHIRYTRMYMYTCNPTHVVEFNM